MEIISKLVSRYHKKTINSYWRKVNPLNETRIAHVGNKETLDFIKSDRIDVGKNTYGVLNIHTSGNKDEFLRIGSNCSISGFSHFWLGGGHELDTITMYPYKKLKFNGADESTTKGGIIIEDEVWIGAEALILSGVTIGKGAVVAAGAIVTHDVPPYSIVGGNPAKIIRYRFSEEIILKIKNIDLSLLKDITDNDIRMLYTKLSESNVDYICEYFKKRMIEQNDYV